MYIKLVMYVDLVVYFVIVGKFINFGYINVLFDLDFQKNKNIL